METPSKHTPTNLIEMSDSLQYMSAERPDQFASLQSPHELSVPSMKAKHLRHLEASPYTTAGIELTPMNLADAAPPSTSAYPCALVSEHAADGLSTYARSRSSEYADVYGQSGVSDPNAVPVNSSGMLVEPRRSCSDVSSESLHRDEARHTAKSVSQGQSKAAGASKVNGSTVAIPNQEHSGIEQMGRTSADNSLDTRKDYVQVSTSISDAPGSPKTLSHPGSPARLVSEEPKDSLPKDVRSSPQLDPGLVDLAVSNAGKSSISDPLAIEQETPHPRAQSLDKGAVGLASRKEVNNNEATKMR